MPLQKYLDRINYLDGLIRTKATGSVKQLAKKMNVSERTVYQYIATLKQFGCPIKFSRSRNSYYYECEGKVIMGFVENNRKSIFGGGDDNPVIFFVNKPNCKNIAVSIYSFTLCFKNKNCLKAKHGSKLQYPFKQYCRPIHKAA